MSRSIVCTQCGHSLSMSDDIYNRRVAGKVVTIKCRQCSTPIRVDGRQDAPGGASAAPQAQASSSHADPLDPFSLPEPNEAAAPKPRPPLPSLDEVVSSAPHIPEHLSQSLTAFESQAEAPVPPGVPAAPQPPGRAAPPAPPAPRARASAPEAPAPEPPRPPPPAGAVPSVADALPPVPPAPASPVFAAAPVAPQPAPQPPAAAPAPVAAPAPAFAAAPAAAMPAAPPHPTPAAVPSGDAFPIAPPAAVPQDLMIEPATLRDPHAAFRRRTHTRTLALVGGAAVLMGGLIFATRGGDEKKPARQEAAQAEKPVIGVSLAPYRSDAHETMPTPAAPSKPPSTRDSGDSTPVDTGSSEDFAKRFKAASGRE